MAEISCSQCQRLLASYVAGHLENEERAQITRHLATCADCQQELAQWQAVNNLFARVHPLAPADDRQRGWRGIIARIDAQPFPESAEGETAMTPTNEFLAFDDGHIDNPISEQRIMRPRRASRWLAPVAALLLVVFGVALFTVLHNERHNLAQQTLPKDIGALYRVVMVSPTEGWAVGNRSVSPYSFTDQPTGSIILHYEMGTWREVANPYSHRKDTELINIVMTSATEGWAAGVIFSNDPRKLNQTILLHYSNGTWQVVPNTFTVDDSYTYVFAKINATNLWAATGFSATQTNGVYGSDSASVLHYDGNTWQRATSPLFTELSADVIWGSSPTDIWLVGHGVGPSTAINTSIVLHFNGTSWQKETQSPNGTMLARIDPLSPTSVWAAGGDTIYHFDNGTWKVALQTSTYSVLGISMVSPIEGWAVGDHLLMRFTNGAWQSVSNPVANEIASGPLHPQPVLFDVAMTSSVDGWAVGTYGTILHYVQGSWTIFAQHGLE